MVDSKGSFFNMSDDPRGQAKFYKIASFTIPGKKYDVIKTEEGYKCNCPNFVFNGRRIKKCDHIRKHQHLKLRLKR